MNSLKSSLTQLSNKELLQLHSNILKELRGRDVVRTSNSPLGDYAEHMIAERLGLQLAPNSQTGYDATDDAGVRYQVKARRITQGSRSRRLSVIRSLNERNFDVLIAVLFDEDYEVQVAVAIPHEVIPDYAYYYAKTNGHNLVLNDAIINDSRVTKLEL